MDDITFAEKTISRLQSRLATESGKVRRLFAIVRDLRARNRHLRLERELLLQSGGSRLASVLGEVQVAAVTSVDVGEPGLVAFIDRMRDAIRALATGAPYEERRKHLVAVASIAVRLALEETQTTSS